VPIQPRNTRKKDAIRSAFLDADRPLSPQEAFDYAQKQVKGISIATVYRNIRTLLDDKWLVSIELPGDAARYEVAGKKHHHHFHCNACGKVFEMEGCGVQLKPKLPHGFRVTGHEFFLYGSCSDCR
jgi:Fur family transcriptional regulator, ferric uptake regulator